MLMKSKCSTQLLPCIARQEVRGDPLARLPLLPPTEAPTEPSAPRARYEHLIDWKVKKGSDWTPACAVCVCVWVERDRR